MSRRFQFSLRWLFLAMLVVAAFFGGAAWQRRQMQLKLRRNERQMEKMTQQTRSAVNEIEALRRSLGENE